MKAVKTLVWAVCILGAVAPVFAQGVFINDYAATKDTFLGHSGTPENGGRYQPDANLGSLKFGRVGKYNADAMIMDFDRAAMLTWINGIYAANGGGAISDISQIRNGAVTMTLNVTAYGDGWGETWTPPPTLFGDYFWPGVRLSKGQNWGEMTATFNNADGLGSPWHDSTGTPLANMYTDGTQWRNNTIVNANSEQWGAADTLGGGSDVYVYDTPRPWKLDDSVAFAALTNPDVVAFQLVADYLNKPWTSAFNGVDDCNGTVYSREHGLTEYRPYVEIMVDASKIGGPVHTYLPADFNKDLKVSFADYLILESNFGKTQRTNATGDADNDTKCSFADYLILEAQFGHTTTPEPATIGLLVLGGLGLLRRRSA
jgi:hypothetical protein